MAAQKYLVWHTPRTASNALMSMLSQTQIAGVADYLNCGFPLGAIGEIERGEFLKKLHEYEDSQTTANGVFGCKLSWEALRLLVGYVGVDYVYSWLDTIDHHVYLYRQDTIAQAVSLYIAAKRGYFSTTKNKKEVSPTPPYDYNEIAFCRLKIESDKVAIQTYFADYKIEPITIAFESMTRTLYSMRESAKLILKKLDLPEDAVDHIEPIISKQDNVNKGHYTNKFLLEWDSKKGIS